MKLAIGDAFRLGGIVALPDDGDLIATGGQVAVDAVIGGVGGAVLEPADRDLARPEKEGERWVSVQVKPVEPLPRPVTLAEIKAEPRLKDMALIKYSRLSVQPVSDQEWEIIRRMGGLPSGSG